MMTKKTTKQHFAKKINQKVTEILDSGRFSWLFSITTKWILLIGIVITFSFVTFSVIIYTSTKDQLMSQEERVTSQTISLVKEQLAKITAPLTATNVAESITPNTDNQTSEAPRSRQAPASIFESSILNGLTRPDISLMIYSPQQELLYATRLESDQKLNPKTTRQQIFHKNGASILEMASPVVASKSRETLGYVVIQNKMAEYNKIMTNLRSWMIALSVIAIVLTILLSFIVVSGILSPIKYMSRVAKEVNQKPEADARIPDLHRRDELGDLAITFNQMLDRMQGYIDQQKHFVEDVSHELRTPVAVIEGHLNLLNRWGKDDPEVLEESISASLQEVTRMKHLIQEMLDLTRAEQIDILYPDEITNVQQVLSQVVENLQLVHPDFQIQFDDDLKPRTEIKMYRNHLEQILIILIDNAIKYSTDHKVVLVSASSDEQRVQIIVQDFGEGIDKKDKSKIFGRFYRVDKARTREHGGNGLGLPIAKKLVESYQGEIDVESAVGSGSQFRINFPLYEG